MNQLSSNDVTWNELRVNIIPDLDVRPPAGTESHVPRPWEGGQEVGKPLASLEVNIKSSPLQLGNTYLINGYNQSNFIM